MFNNYLAERLRFAISDGNNGIDKMHPICGCPRNDRDMEITLSMAGEEKKAKKATRSYLTNVFVLEGIFTKEYLEDLTDDEFYYLLVGLDKAL